VWRFAPKNCLDKYQQGLNESSQKAKQCQCNFTEIQLSEFSALSVFSVDRKWVVAGVHSIGFNSICERF
jgi:hypothetical protein